jgi:hypothetical protein
LDCQVCVRKTARLEARAISAVIVSCLAGGVLISGPCLVHPFLNHFNPVHVTKIVFPKVNRVAIPLLFSLSNGFCITEKISLSKFYGHILLFMLHTLLFYLKFIVSLR